MNRLFILLGLVVVFTLTPNHMYAKETSLQTLINRTPKNKTLQLEARVYEGNIVITKSITLRGVEGTVIKGDGTHNVITVKAQNVVLENFTVTHSGQDRNSKEEYAGIKVMDNHNTVRDITITDSFHGVYLSQAHQNEVSGVDVTGLHKGEVAGQGNGLHLYYSNQNLLKNNTIKETRDGMFFDYSDSNEIIGNDIQHTRYGLHYMYSNENVFTDNRFSFNIGGAAIMQSKGNILKNNEFALNQGTRSFGLLLQAANENRVESNKFYQNQRGIYIDQSQSNDIRKNDVFQNQIGIELWASSQNQTFTENHFSGNTASVLVLGGKAANKWSENGRGNDWGTEVSLLDLDHDEIGDYSVKGQSSLYKLVEENELAYLFLESPAIHLYEKMNEWTNKQEVMFEDRHPIMSSERSMTAFVVILLGIFTGGGFLLSRRRYRS
ncbi:nitrous oxide reductase family maturation protein NosD [Bacillus tianshenii]|nr:nitrous oxide reductase family maturation protein NosD [Bacillus tianshenii]